MNELDRNQMSPDLGNPDGGGNTRLLRVLWRGKWTILFLTLFGGLGGFEYLHGKTPLWDGLTPRYRATARLIVSNREVDPMRGEGAAGVKQTALLNQQRALLKSEAMLKPLSERADIQELRHFRTIDKPTISALNDSLFAGIDAKSDLVLIHFESPHKRDAVVVVDAAVETFLAYHRAKKIADTHQLIDLLDKEIDEKETERDRIKVEAFELKRQNLALFGASGEKNLVTDRLSSTSQSLTEASQKVVEAKAKYEAMSEAKADSRERFLEYGEYYRYENPITVLENRIQPYTNDRITAENDVAKKLASNLTEESQGIKDLRNEIAYLSQKEEEIILQYAQSYLKSTEIALTEAQREEKHFRDAYLSLEGDVLSTEEAANQLSLLDGKRTTVEEELGQLVARVGELTLAEDTGALNIDVMEKARAGSNPVYPDPLQIMGFAIAIGLGLGLGLVFLRGFFDHRIFTVEEVPDLLGTSVLAALPRLPNGKREVIGRIVSEQQGSMAAEAIRSVRTAINFGLPENGKGLLLVTSACAGEGKSVSASNLAIALAQAGRKTILVDADLRKPGQHGIFGLENTAGLGDVLAGGTSTKEAVLKGVARNLDLMPAGDARGRAAELIESKNTRELFSWLRRQYEVVVIDSSPVLETAETRVLASIADLAIFVLRMDVSSSTDAVRARDILMSVNTKILGVLLNGTKPRRGARGYAGGIAYGDYASGYGEKRKSDAA